MYYTYTIKDTIGIPPEYFSTDVQESAKEMLRKKYERIVDKDIGIILAVFNVRDISDGTILPGDPAVHHDVTFDVLAFNLEVEEIITGEVSEMAEFGCFVRIGPVDGLVHMSQIIDEFVNFDRKTGMFTSKSTNRTLKKGDEVYAKVSTISMKNSIKDIKVALTMRPDGLGKLEWLTEEPKERRPQVKRRRK
ncbi:MAG: DNA-directed RNA polymerase [Candidatus Micrarchaeia archaeon]